MPELPDVESFRRYINATSLHQKIKSVSVRKKRVLKEVSASTLAKHLKGKQLTRTLRHGKYLFVNYGKSKWLLLHFGMTGDVRYYKHKKDEPKFAAMVLEFSNGYYFSYINKRLLGQIRLLDNPHELIEKKKLGPDLYDNDFDLKLFRERLSRSRGNIKSAMMNQRIMAGLGNVYVDEALFHTGISLKRKSSGLSDSDTKRLFKTLHRVLKFAIKKRGKPDRFPKSYLIQNRKDGKDCPKCEGTIRRVNVGGRYGYMCNTHQE